jgi:hypothetical protein
MWLSRGYGIETAIPLPSIESLRTSRFRNPEDSGVAIDGICCLRLDRPIELKLASGTTPGQRRDLADVQELIRIFRGPADSPSVNDWSVALQVG